MASTLDTAWLARCPLFGGLSEASCGQFAQRMASAELKPGDVVYSEGDSASSLFILVEGRLDLCKCHNGNQVNLGELSPGEFFGDMSFIDMQPRSMTVRATEPSVICQLEYAALRDVYVSDLKSYTLVVMNIAREMSRRLRVSDEQLFRATMGALPPAPETTFHTI